jgi:hypothetical protein
MQKPLVLWKSSPEDALGLIQTSNFLNEDDIFDINESFFIFIWIDFKIADKMK